MAIETFSWRPLMETPGEVMFRTFSAQFGDGYKQTAANGINNRMESWSLTFKSKEETITAIRNFLDARQGHEPFYWTPKRGVQGLYECVEYNVVNNNDNGTSNGLWTLTATFSQRFDV